MVATAGWMVDDGSGGGVVSGGWWMHGRPQDARVDRSGHGCVVQAVRVLRLQAARVLRLQAARVLRLQAARALWLQARVVLTRWKSQG
jgi:hypothetical protein